jgi:hypothetical protein
MLLLILFLADLVTYAKWRKAQGSWGKKSSKTFTAMRPEPFFTVHCLFILSLLKIPSLSRWPKDRSLSFTPCATWPP